MFLHAAAAELARASLVVVGADAVFSNGSVLARAGTFAVAALARAANVPVLVACEAYKFHDRVQLDAVAANELVDLGAVGGGAARKRHLRYDVTPATYVSAIATEHGLLPPSAVAVLVRELGAAEDKG